MKLNYSKSEIEEKIKNKSLFATPLSFRDGPFTWKAYLTNLHDGRIRINSGHSDDDYFVPDTLDYKSIRNICKLIYNMSWM